MRLYEINRIGNARVVEYQAIWDIPEIMILANARPMAPSLGHELCIPGPPSGDGLNCPPRNAAQSRGSQRDIFAMLTFMRRHPALGGPEVMEMPSFGTGA